jgi:1-deoxy-D-xylulose-5-phosphate synthase
MPGPTGLLSFQDHFPERFFDVGIAEQHALTAAAGMAMAGLHPVVAIYSTFLARAVDQWNLDVGLHRLPVVVVADRAGITGDDGPSHHGLYDMVQALQVPGLAIFAPSEPAELGPALTAALAARGPSLVRYPKTLSPGPLAPVGSGLEARTLREGDGAVVLVGIGKLARACLEAAALLAADGVNVTVIDPRVIRPADPALLEQMATAQLVLTAEDGLAHGGAGAYLCGEAEALAASRGLPGPQRVVLGVPTTYIAHGKPDAILSRLGLDGAGIADSVLAAARRFSLRPG